MKPYPTAGLLLLAVPVILGGDVASAAGQVVRGTVTEGGSGSPVPAAFVQLMDTTGARVGAVLAGADGGFALRAPRGGTFLLRVEALGLATREAGPFTLTPGGMHREEVFLGLEPVALPGVTASGARRCETGPEKGLAVQRVWEEARKALAVAAWAMEERLFVYRLDRRSRQLDPRTGRVLREERYGRRGSAVRPFVTLPPETLVREGFIQEAPEPGGDGRPDLPGEMVAYAPDAAVLLSDAFLDTHCMEVVEEDGGKHRVGLAFRPLTGSRRGEVRGTLWMATEPLRPDVLTFDYVDVPGLEDGVAGGEVSFRQLPTGAWIVDRWAIRAPLRSRVRERTVTGPVEAVRVVGVHEESGQVTRIATPAGEVVARRDGAVLAGVVLDDRDGEELAGAVVRLTGTPYAVRTDDDGRFRMEGLPDGRYGVAFTHPRTEALGLRPGELEVALERGARGDAAAVEVVLRVPALLHDVASEEEAVVGEVVDGGGGPLRGALVRLHGEDEGVATAATADLLTDSLGGFTVPLPPPGRYRVEVVDPDHVLAETPVLTIAAGQRHQLRLMAGHASTDPFASTTRMLRLLLWSADRGHLRFDLVRTRTVVGGSGGRPVLELERSWERGTGAPVTGAQADPLHRDGFMTRNDVEVSYRHLDLRYLLHPGFADRYCPEKARGDGGLPAGPDMTFAPCDRDALPEGRVEVAGAVWAPSEARPSAGKEVREREYRLEYRYVGGGVEDGPMADARGAFTFIRLRSGEPFVARWKHVVPVVGRLRVLLTDRSPDPSDSLAVARIGRPAGVGNPWRTRGRIMDYAGDLRAREGRLDRGDADLGPWPRVVEEVEVERVLDPWSGPLWRRSREVGVGPYPSLTAVLEGTGVRTGSPEEGSSHLLLPAGDVQEARRGAPDTLCRPLVLVAGHPWRGDLKSLDQMVAERGLDRLMVRAGAAAEAIVGAAARAEMEEHLGPGHLQDPGDRERVRCGVVALEPSG